VIPELGAASQNPSGVKKLIFCTGKVFYDIKKARTTNNLENDIAIARVEQVGFIFVCLNVN
jgi:2-oxoglutarate dehydrogenase E1 component